MSNPITTSYAPVDIWFSDSNRYTQPCTIASGQKLLAGDPLGKVTSSGLYIKWTAGASDGSQVGVGILMMPVDASSTGQNADTAASMGVSGVFNNAVLNNNAGMASQFISQIGGRIGPQNTLIVR